MLPTHLHHRPPPALEHLARHNKGTNPFTRFLTRWIIIGCCILATVWLAKPFIEETVWGTPMMDRRPHIRPIQRPSPTKDEQKMWSLRKNEVRETFKHAWTGYLTRAFPSDELDSVSGHKSDRFNGWSVTLFDSLSTLWIMGLREEFADAVESVQNQTFVSAKPSNYVPFFETVIRYLGGTLSAYALSENKTLLRLADDLGKVLVPAFNGTKTGLPTFSVNVAEPNKGNFNYDYGGGSCLFAEATSCQLEFKYLAKLTNKKEYYESVDNVMEIIYKANPPNGLFSERYSTDDATPVSTHYTIGASSDSGYEYFLKQWIMTGDTKARDQYIKSANGIINNLINLTPERGLMYVSIMDRTFTNPIFEHLACFFPGTLALGLISDLELTPEERQLHEWAATGLANTCYITYADQATGLGPERMTMTAGPKWVDEIAKWRAEGRQGPPPGTADPIPVFDATKRDYSNTDGRYLLRPETVESIFYMWRITQDNKWRDRAYEIYRSIEKYTRTDAGYASLYAVDKHATRKMDEMPSFFLAETLKYLYLTFDDINNIPLDKWVFNTEAHPLPIFKWTEAQQQAFNITT